MSKINYRAFIEDWFLIKNKDGLLIPFLFNDVQEWYYEQLEADYPELQGIRENDLKGRQFGISSMIAAIFTVDFILSALGEIPLTDSDIYTHKDKETKSHWNRVNMFLNCYLLKDQGGDYAVDEHREALPYLRKHFLKTDNDSGFLESKNGTQIQTATAGAKVSGRGSTKTNILWSEIAFYPNTPVLSAESLVTGAEEQVPTGRGKIFRESTGHLLHDYFAREYKLGKEGKSESKSRFMAWFKHKAYSTLPPSDWSPPTYYDRLLSSGLADLHQCFWHYQKTRGLTDKKRMREYPTYDTEAFLAGGASFFDGDALTYHLNRVRNPLKEVHYVSAL